MEEKGFQVVQDLQSKLLIEHIRLNCLLDLIHHLLKLHGRLIHLLLELLLYQLDPLTGLLCLNIVLRLHSRKHLLDLLRINEASLSKLFGTAFLFHR